jgi:tape measure domain-containing protein
VADTDLASMGAIFNKVAASGKLSGQVLNQLSDRGIPVLQLLAKQYGVTADEARKMVSDGKVQFGDFVSAMDSAMGGAAKKVNTFEAAISNMNAAFGRMGEMILKPFRKLGKDVLVDKLIPMVDRITTVLQPHIEKVGEMLEGPIMDFFNQIEPLIEPIAESLGQIFEILGQAIANIIPILPSLIEMFSTFLDVIVDIIAPVNESHDALYDLFMFMQGAFLSVLIVITSVVGGLIVAFHYVSGAVWGVIGAVQYVIGVYSAYATVIDDVAHGRLPDLELATKRATEWFDKAAGSMTEAGKRFDEGNAAAGRLAGGVSRLAGEFANMEDRANKAANAARDAMNQDPDNQTSRGQKNPPKVGDNKNSPPPPPGGGGSRGGGGKSKVSTVDKVKNVNLSKEDRQLLYDIAEKKYVNSVNVKTLAPNTQITVNNNGSKSVSAGDVAAAVRKVIEQQTSVHSGRSYSY